VAKRISLEGGAFVALKERLAGLDSMVKRSPGGSVVQGGKESGKSVHISFFRRTMMVLALSCGAFTPLMAQNNAGCFFLCRPELKIEPTFTVENLFSQHRVAEMEGDNLVAVTRSKREVIFEMILALDIPTEIPRVGFTFETIFIPFASGSENPFTGRTAHQLGRTSIRNNSPEVEIELNLEWLRPKDTKEWVCSHFDIVDKISPAERPGDAGAYTHKLNFELDTAVSVFNWLPKENWLRNIEVEGSLDYVATGLPRAGDRIGNELFLDHVGGWSFSLVFVIPLVPLRP